MACAHAWPQTIPARKHQAQTAKCFQRHLQQKVPRKKRPETVLLDARQRGDLTLNAVKLNIISSFSEAGLHYNALCMAGAETIRQEWLEDKGLHWSCVGWLCWDGQREAKDEALGRSLSSKQVSVFTKPPTWTTTKILIRNVLFCYSKCLLLPYFLYFPLNCCST